jgi:heat shock protein HslJ
VYLSKLRCEDGSPPLFYRIGNYGSRNPLPEQKPGESREEFFKRVPRSATLRGVPLKPGETDYHIVDGYRLSCKGVQHTLLLDMYHCDGKHSSVAPPGFSIVQFSIDQPAPNVARGADPTPIEGKTWQLSDLTGFPGFEFIEWPRKRAPNFRLEPSGKLIIFDGCNDFTTDYVSTSDSITVGRGWMGTQLGCNKASGDSRNKFNALFRGTVTWRIVGGQLQLLDKVGQVEAVFQCKVNCSDPKPSTRTSP